MRREPDRTKAGPKSPAKSRNLIDMSDGMDAVRRPLWMRLFAHDVSAPLLLLLLALAIFIPGQWTIPPLDRDEPRFTQATKQMLETDNYVDIRFQEEARHKKPVGIYWIQAAAVKMTGFGADAPLWAYRLPSLIAACLTVLFVYWTARAFVGPPAALVAGLFCLAAIILGVEARLAKTDAVLFASIALAQGALARIWLNGGEERRWGLAFLFWTGLAVGVLVKGPVALMVLGFTIAGIMVLTRKFAWFKSAAPLAGLLWFVALVLPWFVAIYIATDGAFFQEAVGKDLLGKVGQGQEGHGAPPLTHLGVMFGVFWPLPAFVLLALGAIWRGRASPLVVFCAAWFLPSWVVFELVATKLPHYTMPLLPALAIPVGAALMEGVGRQSNRALRWIAAVLLAIPALALAVASFAGPLYLGDWPSPPGAVLAVFGALLAIGAASRLVQGRPLDGVPLAVAASVVLTIGIWGFTGPALKTIWISPRLTDAITESATCTDPAVASAGFNEPSFIFLQGTQTALVSGKDAADFLAGKTNAGITPEKAGACRIAVVESRQEQAFLEAANANGLVPELRKRVDGLNINGGKRMDIGLYVHP
ncbi:ArnT family glycosyltransferase [Roseibium suaedae]|uniref:4-amino-4-deoxy-L-arabinose transferase n=1 Tax=Roseibium suaedae TaxID=735517 RepID=A0A1M7PD70_9HYPH|nr:glycosyltransferase family 39 protein [Roseibium suaedae]SHN14916.1 4-amino-4-deoxy-L-arabinose transferase [Roseibium suaedae]